ncbi:MAG: aspartate aminotransferase family protein [Candidatus Rokubacteria bacterium]|nr:aspartate aminotransferase family protein [Candidatus Rokubacteria bacterium]
MNQDTTPRSQEESALLELAAKRLPGGVLGTARHRDELAFVVKRAQGARLWDWSGREYIDYLLGSGPMFLGHAHPAVTKAVTRQLEDGTTYFMVNEPAIRLADEICRAVPCAEQIRFTSTGSEATFFAMRAARAFRHRDKIMKFEGGYHGSNDYAHMSQTPRSPKAFPAAMPDSAGIPHVLEGEVLIAPYNDLATVEALLAVHADSLAAVIVEPFQRVIPPRDGFLEGLRRLTRRYGIVLIFDEVVTGFRFAYGGAQEHYGVTPDLASFGKIIGGGFPLAAVAGRADIMQGFDPRGEGTGAFVSQTGTLNGNPVASAAGLASLAELRKPGAYERVNTIGGALMTGLADLTKKLGITAQVVGHPTVFDIFFTDTPIMDWRATLTNDGAKLRRFNEACLKRGILKGASKIYVSCAHTEKDVEQTLAVFKEALTA